MQAAGPDRFMHTALRSSGPPQPYVWPDAKAFRVRQDGRLVNMAAVLAADALSPTLQPGGQAGLSPGLTPGAGMLAWVR